MDRLTLFITIIAWAFLLGALGLIVLRVYGAFEYSRNEVAQKVDYIKGIKRTFPIEWPLALAVVCAAWIAAYNFS